MLRFAGAILSLFFVVAAIGSVSAEENSLSEGIRLANSGSYEKAIKVLKKSVSEDPKDATKQLALGVVLLESGKTKEAETVLTEAAELNAEMPSVHYALAMLYEKDRKIELSIKAWRQFAGRTKDPMLKEQALKHLTQLEEEMP